MAQPGKHRRSSYISKPNFQIKLTLVLMLVVTIVANLVGGIVYLFLSEKVQSLMAANPEAFAGIEMADVAGFLVPKILMAEAISLCLVFVLAVLITHTIAGPVYRLEKEAGEVAKGDLSKLVRLRPRDEFKELADAFNEMCHGLAFRIQGVRRAVEAVEAENPDGDFAPVYAALDEFKLPEENSGGGHSRVEDVD